MLPLQLLVRSKKCRYRCLPRINFIRNPLLAENKICLYPVPLGMQMTALLRTVAWQVQTPEEMLSCIVGRQILIAWTWPFRYSSIGAMLTFNATKTQAGMFSTKRSQIHLALKFRCVSVPLTDSLQVLGVELSSNLNFGQYIESKAQIAAKKLESFLRSGGRYYTPDPLLQLYLALLRFRMENCHL